MNWQVFVLVLLFPAFCFAQSPAIQTVPPGEDKITVLPKGEKAPYSGQLFDNPTALRWAHWLQQYKFRLDFDVEREQQMCSARVDYYKDLNKIEKERNKKVELDLRVRLKRSEEARLKAEEEYRNPPWYNTRTFGVIIGVVSTSVVFGLSVYAVDQLK